MSKKINRIVIGDDVIDEPKQTDPFSFDGFTKSMSTSAPVDTGLVDIVPTDDAPIKKRGRKPGQKNKPKEPIASQSEPTDTTIPADLVLTGAMMLMFFDFIIPAGLVFLNNKSSKSKISMKQMQLTDDEKAKLEPLADKVVQQMQINISPVTALILGMVVVYSTKFLVIKNT